MKKEEFLRKLDELNLDKNKYCIISGGVMLLYDLKDTTNDIDLRMSLDYFEELKKRFRFKKSSKYPYLFELGEDIEVAVKDFDKSVIRMVNGYPVESLEQQLDWMIKNKREKDKEKIIIIQNYLKNK